MTPVWAFTRFGAFHHPEHLDTFRVLRHLPKRWFDSPLEAMATGLRPCKGCKPLRVS